MRGAEGVVYENVGQRSELFGELGIILGLALFKAGVLQQHDLAVLQRRGKRLCAFTHDVLCHLDGLAEQLGKTVRDDLEGERGLGAVLGLSHVGAENDTRAVLDEILDGRQSGHDALVAGDDAALGGDVEIAAAEHTLAANVDVFYGFLVVIHDVPPDDTECFTS